MGVVVWKCGVKERKKQLIDWSLKIKSTNKNHIEMKTGKRSRKCVLMLSFIFSSFLLGWRHRRLVVQEEGSPEMMSLTCSRRGFVKDFQS